jgi:hypothetical protein
VIAMITRAFRRSAAAAPETEPCMPYDPIDLYEGARVVALADRRTYDVDVVLLWARRTGRLWVNVTHRASGRMARIDATPANALDVFHHPFAHAAE